MLRSLFLVFLLALSFQAYASPPPPKQLHVGAIFPLSGPAAEHGVAAKNGFLMGIAEFDKDQRINFEFEDDGYNPKNTISAYRKLTRSSEIDILLTTGSGPSNAVAPIANAEKIPTLALAGDSHVAIGRDYVIRLRISAVDEGIQLAELLNKRGYSRVGVVCAQNSFTLEVCRGVAMGLTQKPVLEDYVLPEEADFRASIERMKQDNVDCTVILLMPGKIGVYAKQARALGLNVDFAGGVFFESDGDYKSSNKALDNAIYVMSDPSPSFANAYEKKYPPTASIGWAAIFYDAARILSQLHSNDEILKQLKNLNDFPGTLGSYTYKNTENGDSYYSFPFRPKIIKEGLYVRLEEAHLQKPDNS